VGSPDEVRDWELRDIPFEPILFRGSFAQPFSPRMKLATLLLIPAAASLGHLLLLLLVPIQFRSGRLPFSPAVSLWVGIVAALALVAWLCPTYFRVVPGRLDVMGFFPWRANAQRYESYDLRRATICVDLQCRVVAINDGARSVEFGIRFMRDSKQFARALFAAALCSWDPPPLPQDDLLG
jgi:hypothetical protein